MATKPIERNLLSPVWESVAQVNTVLKPSDRGYALSFGAWGLGYWMANQEPSNTASGLMLAGLVGAGTTKFLKKRFAEYALKDQLNSINPEVAVAYLEHLKLEKGGAFRRAVSSIGSFVKTGVIAGGLVYATLNAPQITTTTCQVLDNTSGQMVNSPCP